jgi:hypothetical protein
MTRDDEDKVIFRKPTLAEVAAIFVFLMVWATIVAAAVLTIGEAR